MRDSPEKPIKAAQYSVILRAIRSYGIYVVHCKSLRQSVSQSVSQQASQSLIQSFSQSVCSLHEAVKLWCLYALQQYTPPSVWDFRGPLRVDGHTHTHTHTLTHTRTQLHAIPLPPLPPSFPPFASCFSLFQCLWGPQSAAGMMDSRLISKANDSSPLTSQNGLTEASVPFTWKNMTHSEEETLSTKQL